MTAVARWPDDHPIQQWLDGVGPPRGVFVSAERGAASTEPALLIARGLGDLALRLPALFRATYGSGQDSEFSALFFEATLADAARRLLQADGGAR